MENKHKQFNAFDKVLVRVGTTNEWECDFYSHYVEGAEYPHKTLGWRLKDENIIPFEGNEHLVGTTDEPEEEIELKKGEWVVFFDKDEMGYPPFYIGRFDFIASNMFNGETGVVRELCIRLSDFNPNDMKETKRHILCVKNGKVVRYKE